MSHPSPLAMESFYLNVIVLDDTGVIVFEIYLATMQNVNACVSIQRKNNKQSSE